MLFCDVKVHFLNVTEWESKALEFIVGKNESFFIEDELTIQDNVIKYIRILFFNWKNTNLILIKYTAFLLIKPVT